MKLSQPLEWPKKWPRTPLGERLELLDFAQIASAPANVYLAWGQLTLELIRSDAIDPTLTCNLGVTSAGFLAADNVVPIDQGATVYFTLPGASYVFGCDKYRKIECNINALTTAIRSCRSHQFHLSDCSLIANCYGVNFASNGRQDQSA